MSDTSLNKIIQYGTNAERIAFTPNPASSSQVLYIWYETDNAPDTYVWDGSAWVKINSGGTGDVVGPSLAVNGEIVLFDGTTGKLIKSATGNGIAHVTSGVLSAGNVDLTSEVTGDLPFSNLTTASAGSILLGRGDSGAGDYEEITLGTNLSITGTTLNASGGGSTTRAITFIIDGGGSALTTGIKADVYIPYSCTITTVTMLADQSGSCVVDIWKDTYANYPPTVADSITASAKPTISSATNSQDSTLTGWTTSISAGDTLRFNIDSAATITRLSLTLTVTV